MLKTSHITAPKLKLLSYDQVVSAQRGQSNLVTIDESLAIKDHLLEESRLFK